MGSVLGVNPYSQWVSTSPSRITTTQRYLYFTTLAVFLLAIASTQRPCISSLKNFRHYFLHSHIGQKIHSFYLTRCIQRSYYLDDALYADVNLSTLSTYSRLHIQALAGLLKKYPQATKTLSLFVTDRSAPDKDQQTATQEFASELVTQFAQQESLKDHPLFQHAPDGFRLIPVHRNMLSDEDSALCQDVGTILGAWGLSPFLQEYKLGKCGQLFPTDFYTGLVFLARHSQYLEQPFYKLSRQDREHICLFLANTTVCHPLYAIPWQEGFEMCSTKQLHTLWTLMIETVGQQIIDETTWNDQLRCDPETIKWMRGYLHGYAYKTCYAQAAALHAVAQGMNIAWPRLKRYLNKNFASSNEYEYAARALSERIQGVYVLPKKRRSSMSISEKMK